jgi:leucyl-tRNA synthetase
MMEFVNELYKSGAGKDDLVALAKMLKPFAPHLACEMLEKLDSDDIWPKWDDALLVDETVEMIVQVNGKLRARIQIPAEDAKDKAKLEEYALADEKVKALTGDKEIIKTIVVPQGKLVNIVIKG